MTKAKKMTSAFIAAAAVLIYALFVVIPQTTAHAADAWDGTTIATAFAGGDGTENSPYEISTGAELAYLAKEVNAGTDYSGNYFKLTADIDLGGKEWTPIGNNTTYFAGTFSGDGNVIKNLTITAGSGAQGLFGYNSGTIINLGIASGSISGYYAGGVCAKNYGTINSCYNNADTSGNRAGGVCADNYGTINGCYNNADASGNRAGGICGENNGTISNCYNTGDITGTSSNSSVGGICGYVEEECPVDYCYNAGNINTETRVGGIAGDEFGSIGLYCYYLKGTADYAYKYSIPLSTGLELGKPKTLAELCTLDIDGESGTVWSAGAVTEGEADGNFRTDTYTLPYLTAFGADSAQSLTVDKFNFGYNGADDWQEYTPISTVEELQAINDDLSGNYVLMNDIDLDGVEWTPIGDNSYSPNAFTGKFSGNGNVIKNISVTVDYYAGLFAENDGLIMNVGMESGSISGTYPGGICVNNYGTIFGCYNNADITGSYQFAGGICYTNYGTIDNCLNSGSVTNTKVDASLTNAAGGIVGNNFSYSIISNCVNMGNVSAEDEANAIIGDDDAHGEYITNCYYLDTTAEHALYYSEYVTSVYSDSGKLTISELCGALPSGLSDTVWSAGSASFAASDVTVDENDERMGTASVKLPYLTVFGENAQQTVEVKVYNFSLTDTPDWQTYTPITTAEQLQAVNDDLDGNYVLMNNIDLDGVEWTPIGTFTGIFSGNGKVVKDLTITTQGNYIGLFRENYGIIMNLGVEGTVTCDEGSYVGGIVGYNHSTVSDCYFKGNVSARSQQGGIVGFNQSNGIIANCFAIGSVTGSGNYAGGIVGYSSGTISDSYCASTVTLTGEYTNKGGVCGLNSGTITNCFYNKDIYTDEDSTVGVAGITTLDMTAADILETMGFDTDVWGYKAADKENGIAYYPYLKDFEESTAPSVSYETKLTLAYDDEKAAPIYGESLFFEIGALVKFDGMNDFVPVKGGYTKGAGSFRLQRDGSDITESFDIYDGAEVQLEYMNGDIGAGERTFTLVYSADSSDFLKDGTAEYTVTIEKAEYILPTIPAVADSYTYGTKLSEISLGDSVWTWAQPDTIPDAGIYSGMVVFTPDADTIANFKVEDIDSWSANTMGFEAYTDIEVTAAVIDSITVSFDAPVAEQTFDTTVEIVEDGILNATIHWCTNIDDTQQDVTDSIAQYSGEYWAHISIEADRNHVFASELDITAPTNDTFYDIMNDYKGVSLTVNFEKLPKGEITSIKLTAPTKTEYTIYDDLDLTGGKLTVTYKSGEIEEIDLTTEMVSGFDYEKSGVQTITVTYSSKTATFDVNVKNAKSYPPAITAGNTTATTFTDSLEISITVPELGDSVIYYTTDGSDPTTESTVYTQPFTITKTTTVKAIAVWETYDPSDIVSITYTKVSEGVSDIVGGNTSGGSSGGAVSDGIPTVDGERMNWNAAAKELAEMSANDTAVIKMNGGTDIPAAAIEALAKSGANAEFQYNSLISWEIDGEDIAKAAAADLDVTYPVQINTIALDGKAELKFRINDTNVPAAFVYNFGTEYAGRTVGLYKKSESGVPELVANVKVSEDGKARFDLSANGDYALMLMNTVIGDVTNDGRINALDAAAILRDIVGIEAAPNAAAMDFDGNGKVNALDASAILVAIINGAA